MLLYRLIAKENILYVPIASREFTTVESKKVCFDQKIILYGKEKRFKTCY